MGFGIFSDESRDWMLTALDRLIELTNSADSDFVVEEEFWGKSDAERKNCRLVKRADGMIVSGKELNKKIAVAGVFARPDKKYVLPSLKVGDRLVLVRERDNDHDENAIRVETLSAKNKLGYIPRQTAAVLAVELDRGYDHTGVIEEVDTKTQKIIISISRREHLPIDDVTSIDLRETSGIPGLSESNIVTTVYFNPFVVQGFKTV